MIIISLMAFIGLYASAGQDAGAWQRLVPYRIMAPNVVKTPACTDNDGDGYQGLTHNSSGYATCLLTTERDCNDDTAAIKPGAIEACNGGIDDNCDGKVDVISDEVISYTASWSHLVENCPEEARFKTGYNTGVCYYLYICRFCEDSDGGADLEHSGQAASYHGVIEDSCGENGKLNEAVCRASWYESIPTTVPLDCPSGSVCRDGRCVKDLMRIPTRVYELR